MPTTEGTGVIDLFSAYGIIGGGAIFTALMVYAGWKLWTPKMVAVPALGEGQMKKDEYERQQHARRDAERQLISDMVGDGLLALHTAGKLSPEGYKNWHLRFGLLLNMPDLMPGKLNTKELKDILQKRRNGGTYYGLYKTVAIPGPKPGERKLNALEEILFRKQA